MGKLGFYFDSTLCIGCRTCQVACKDKNGLPAGISYRVVRSFETGDYPTPDSITTQVHATTASVRPA